MHHTVNGLCLFCRKVQTHQAVKVTITAWLIYLNACLYGYRVVIDKLKIKKRNSTAFLEME